jgi:hypothetical protein
MDDIFKGKPITMNTSQTLTTAEKICPTKGNSLL